MTMVQEFPKKEIEEKNRVLESAIKLSDVRDDIIDFFRKRIFLHKASAFRTKEKELEEESEKNKVEKIKDDYNKFFTYTEDESTGTIFSLNIIFILQYLVL